MHRAADVGFLRRAAAELGLRHRDGLTISHRVGPSAWETYRKNKSSILESPLISYRPQEGTPDMMMVDVGSTAPADVTSPCFSRYKHTLQIGDVVRATNALQQSGIFGTIGKAVRAGTVGIVQQQPTASSAMVNWTGYFDHPLGLPMVMERTDGDAWRAQRLKTGPVQRILPTGQLVGLERGMLLAAADGDEGGGASWLAGAASADASPLLPHVRDEHRASVAMEAPLDSLEVSNGSAWQPMSAAASQRRQATAPMHAASLPYLRRISEGRKSGARPLLGWGHDEGFFRPGADTSMVHDAPVVAYDGAGVGRDFNLL